MASKKIAAAVVASTFDRWVGYLKNFYAVTLAPLLDLRTIVLGSLAAYLLARDMLAAKSFLMPLGLVCAVLALTHWFRKSHMPYLDQAVMVAKAEENPIAAAIVYAATRAFDAAILLFVLFAAVR